MKYISLIFVITLHACAPPFTGTWSGPFELKQQFGDLRYAGTIAFTFTKATYTSTGFDIDAICNLSIKAEDKLVVLPPVEFKGSLQANTLFLKLADESRKAEATFYGKVYRDAITGTFEWSEFNQVFYGKITLLRNKAKN